MQKSKERVGQEKEKFNPGLQSEGSDGKEQEISEDFGDTGANTAKDDHADDETIEIGNRFHELSWASYYLRYQEKYNIKEFDLERTFYNQLFLFAI